MIKILLDDTFNNMVFRIKKSKGSDVSTDILEILQVRQMQILTNKKICIAGIKFLSSIASKPDLSQTKTSTPSTVFARST